MLTFQNSKQQTSQKRPDYHHNLTDQLRYSLEKTHNLTKQHLLVPVVYTCVKPGSSKLKAPQGFQTETLTTSSYCLLCLTFIRFCSIDWSKIKKNLWDGKTIWLRYNSIIYRNCFLGILIQIKTDICDFVGLLYLKSSVNSTFYLQVCVLQWGSDQ